MNIHLNAAVYNEVWDNTVLPNLLQQFGKGSFLFEPVKVLNLTKRRTSVLSLSDGLVAEWEQIPAARLQNLVEEKERM